MPEQIANNNYVSSTAAALPTRVRRAVDDILAGVELKAARVGAGRAPADELEEEFKKILDGTRAQFPDRAGTLEQNITRPLADLRIHPRFARFAGVDLATPGAIDAVDIVTPHRQGVEFLFRNWVNIPPVVEGLVPVTAEDLLLPQAGYTGLDFHVSKVKCVEETDGWGSDEIYVGGNFIDETGEPSYYWWLVSNDFDTGEVVDYGFPGKRIQHFNLLEGGSKFPKVYTAALAMVEEDWGNMSGWFKDLFEKIKAKIKQELKKLGIAVGEMLGLGPASQLIGEIFAAVFDWLVGWIVSLFENDYMGTVTTRAAINSYTGNWVSTGGPVYSWSKKYKAYGGHYHLWYAWVLTK